MPHSSGDLYQGASAGRPGASPSSSTAYPQTRPCSAEIGFGLFQMLAMAMAAAPARNPKIAPHWVSAISLRKWITPCLYSSHVPNEKTVPTISPQNPDPRPTFSRTCPR